MHLKSGSLQTGKPCSECPKPFDQLSPNQVTCGPKCKAKRQARIAREKLAKSKK